MNPVVAALQMTSGPDVSANLAVADRLLRAAADAGDAKRGLALLDKLDAQLGS